MQPKPQFLQFMMRAEDHPNGHFQFRLREMTPALAILGMVMFTGFGGLTTWMFGDGWYPLIICGALGSLFFFVGMWLARFYWVMRFDGVTLVIEGNRGPGLTARKEDCEAFFKTTRSIRVGGSSTRKTVKHNLWARVAGRDQDLGELVFAPWVVDYLNRHVLGVDETAASPEGRAIRRSRSR